MSIPLVWSTLGISVWKNANRFALNNYYVKKRRNYKKGIVLVAQKSRSIAQKYWFRKIESEQNIPITLKRPVRMSTFSNQGPYSYQRKTFRLPIYYKQKRSWNHSNFLFTFYRHLFIREMRNSNRMMCAMRELSTTIVSRGV